MYIKIFIVIFYFFSNYVFARDAGQTEITTEEGIEVYQKEKYYLLKKNVIINSDNFNLTADNVKAYFEKDLYDIVDIHSKGKVVLISNKGIEAKGDKIDFNIKNENILIEGKNSFLNNKNFEMKSDELIKVDNISGKFKLTGINSQITTSDTIIIGHSIDGNYINIDGENVVQKLHVEDKTQVNIKTDKLNMFSLKADFDRENDIIELFDNVKIFKGEELITGDYARINTIDDSYSITSNKTKKVTAILKRTDTDE